MIFTIVSYIMQVQQQVQIDPSTPNIFYDIIKQSLTVGAIVALLILFFKGKQKEIDARAELLAKQLEDFKELMKEQRAEIEKDYEHINDRVDAIEKDNRNRFDDIIGKIGELTTEVKIALEKLKSK